MRHSQPISAGTPIGTARFANSGSPGKALSTSAIGYWLLAIGYSRSACQCPANCCRTAFHMRKSLLLLVVAAVAALPLAYSQTPTPSPSAAASATAKKRTKKAANPSPSPAASPAASTTPAGSASPKKPHAKKSPSPAASPAAVASPTPSASPKNPLGGLFGKKASPSPAPVGSPGAGQVWVNTETHVYHKAGSRFYGKTKQGKYMSEQEAIKEGDHAAKNE
jgi:hypothetical protein